MKGSEIVKRFVIIAIIILSVFTVVNAGWPYYPELKDLPDIHTIYSPDVYDDHEYEDFQYVTYYIGYNQGGKKILELSTLPLVAHNMIEYGPYFSLVSESGGGTNIKFQHINGSSFAPDDMFMLENNVTGAGSILYSNYDILYAGSGNLMKAATATDPPIYVDTTPDYYTLYPGDTITLRYNGTSPSVIVPQETYGATYENVWTYPGIGPDPTQNYNITSYDEIELEPGAEYMVWKITQGSITFTVPKDPDIYRNVTRNEPGGNVIPEILEAGDSITMRNDGISPSVVIDTILNNLSCEYVYLWGGGAPSVQAIVNSSGSADEELEIGDEMTIWKITSGTIQIDVPDNPYFYYSITRATDPPYNDFDYINPPNRNDPKYQGIFGGIQYGVDYIIYFIGYPFIALVYIIEKFQLHLTTLTNSIGQMNSAMSSIVSWMPAEVIAMLVLGIIVGVIMKILGR